MITRNEGTNSLRGFGNGASTYSLCRLSYLELLFPELLFHEDILTTTGGNEAGTFITRVGRQVAEP